MGNFESLLFIIHNHLGQLNAVRCPTHLDGIGNNGMEWNAPWVHLKGNEGQGNG